MNTNGVLYLNAELDMKLPFMSLFIPKMTIYFTIH